jgi:hypothetical protein
MTSFSINYIEGLIYQMNSDYRKLLSVIKSMNATIQVPCVRTYIDLYYRKNGVNQKEMIEYYFKVKRKALRD